MDCKEEGVNMKVIVKYSNRKMYDKETSKYVNLEELVSMPLDSVKVIDKSTGNDVTVNALLSYLSNNTENQSKESKIRVMRHCIGLLST